MSNNDHPRRYRVERNTPGVDWSEWTYTYHRTREAAQKAIDKFFRAEGHYSYLRTRGRADSWVTVSERFQPVMPATITVGTWRATTWLRRNVRYTTVETIEAEAWNAEQAANVVAKDPTMLADALEHTEALDGAS